MNLVYTAEAIADLTRLRAFIAERDPAAASRVSEPLVAHVENLRLFPHIGRPVTLAPDPKSIRDAVFGKYVIRYSVHSQTVVVLRIWRHYENREGSI